MLWLLLLLQHYSFFLSFNSSSILRRGSSDKNASRLTSAVKPLMELHSAEAVIDIKPDLDDDLITEDHAEMTMTSGRLRVTSGRSMAELHRSRVPPGASFRSSGRTAGGSRPSDERFYSAYGRSSRSRGGEGSGSSSSKVRTGFWEYLLQSYQATAPTAKAFQLFESWSYLIPLSFSLCLCLSPSLYLYFCLSISLCVCLSVSPLGRAVPKAEGPCGEFSGAGSERYRRRPGQRRCG